MFTYTSNIDKSQQKKYLNYSSAYTTTNPTSILGYCKNSVLGAQNTQQQTQAPSLAAVKSLEFAADNKNVEKIRGSVHRST